MAGPSDAAQGPELAARTAGAPARRPFARRRPWLLHPMAKPVLTVLVLLPFAWLFHLAYADRLGANPGEALIRRTGDWTLRFLCLTLAITPLRTVLKQPALARFRRLFGLAAFFYGCLHFLSYSWLDKDLVLPDILRDIAKRPFILVGTVALALMAPLALTSFNRAIKAMGAARWQALHKAIYAVALLALLHFFWMRAAKHNFREWSVYAAVIGVLLGWRVWRAVGAHRRAIAADTL